MIQKAIDELLGSLAQVPEGGDEWQKKAKIICDFSLGVAAEVLRRVGFNDPGSEEWKANLMVDVFQGNNIDFPPPDMFASLYLLNTPTALDLTEEYLADYDHHLIFGQGRVLDWDSKTYSAKRVLSYEHAARLVIYWLKIKILEICRDNEQDRIAQLPDLFDRLEAFEAASPPSKF